MKGYFSILVIFFCYQLNAQAPVYTWGKSFGGKARVFPKGIAVDKSKNVYIAGVSFNTSQVDFDPGPNTVKFNLNYDITNAFLVKLDESGNFKWAKVFDYANSNPNIQNASSFCETLELDELGNPIMGGIFYDTVNCNVGGTPHLLYAKNNLYAAFIVKFDSLGNYIASNYFNGENVNVYKLRRDHMNNIYCSGTFFGNVSFGSDNISSSAVNSFVAKLDANLTPKWAKHFNCPNGWGYNFAASVAIDSNLNVYTVGSFERETDFDPGVGVYKLYDSGAVGTHNGAFISKLDSTGNFIYAKKIGLPITYDTLASINFASDVAINSNQELILSGHYGTLSDFDPGPAIDTLRTIGSTESFLLKLDKDGNYKWTKRFQVQDAPVIYSGFNYINEILLDSCDNIYVGGDFYDNIDLDLGAGKKIYHSASDLNTNYYQANSFVCKLNPDGQYLWGGVIQSLFMTNIGGIALDNEKNIYSTGMFTPIVDLNPDEQDSSIFITQVNGTSSVDMWQDAFVNKLSQACNLNNNIVLNDSIFIAAQNNVLYQWFDCTNNTPIIGANSQSFTPSAYGTYGVVLMKDSCCIATSNCLTYAEVVDPPIIDSSQIILPNAFTPNADIVNNIFKPIVIGNLNLKTYSFKIFNRYGNQVFTTQNILEGWDGTMFGVPCGSDTYFYLLNAISVSGKSISLRGDVLLLR